MQFPGGAWQWDGGEGASRSAQVAASLGQPGGRRPSGLVRQESCDDTEAGDADEIGCRSMAWKQARFGGCGIEVVEKSVGRKGVRPFPASFWCPGTCGRAEQAGRAACSSPVLLSALLG